MKISDDDEEIKKDFLFETYENHLEQLDIDSSDQIVYKCILRIDHYPSSMRTVLVIRKSKVATCRSFRLGMDATDDMRAMELKGREYNDGRKFDKERLFVYYDKYDSFFTRNVRPFLTSNTILRVQ